jgi:hypothetical protein
MNAGSIYATGEPMSIAHTEAEHSSEPANEEQKFDANAKALREARSWLASAFCIESAFIGVPKLSRILGIANSTIHGYLRAGTFFIPCRLFNKTPMFSLDDVARWYVAGGEVVRGEAVGPSAAKCQQEFQKHAGTKAAEWSESERIVQETLAQMKRSKSYGNENA